MNFKEWLLLQEKFRGLKRLFKQENPNIPAPVAKELYNSRIAHTMKKVLSDPNKNIPKDSSSQIFNASGFKNSTWTKKPQILSFRGQEGITPANFDQKTQNYFLHRLFGLKEEPLIRNDLERTNIQKNIMNSREEGKNEPVIVKLTNHGYELLEGWHRTMNILLKGCPLDQLELLKKNEIRNINFSKWNPVKILAYVGTGPEMQKWTAGTGEYNVA